MASAPTSDIHDSYRGLADFIGPHMDSGLGVFKRFGKLNTLNLLYMQAELLNLEQLLRVTAKTDEAAAHPVPKSFARNVGAMLEHPSNPQWKLILEIREKLHQYNKAVLQQANLAQLSKARKYDGRMLTHWLLHKEGGNRFPTGVEARPWTPGELHDLMAISNRNSNDSFTRWVEESIIPWIQWMVLYPWKKSIKGHEKTGIVNYADQKFKSLARVTTILLSTVLPSIAVLGLYYINSLSARLFAIIGFSASFSLVLAGFTNARPIEIFTATASFAAVQVVFVGGSDQGTMRACECIAQGQSPVANVPAALM